MEMNGVTVALLDENTVTLLLVVVIRCMKY